MSSNTEGTGNTEEDCVELHLVETVVGQENTRVGVNIGPGVLSLASLSEKLVRTATGDTKSMPYLEQDVRHDVVDLTNKLEERIIGKVLESKFALSSVTGVGLPQYGVSVSRDNLSALQGGPDVLLDGLVAGVFADLVLHLGKPDEDFLVSETVKRSGKAVKRR